MSTEKEKRQQKIIVVVKEFTNPKHRKMVQEGVKRAKEAEKALGKTINVLELMMNEVNRGNIDKAEKLYKKVFVNTGNLRIKGAVSQTEIKKFLNNKSLVKQTLDKAKKSKAYITKVLGPCAKVVDAYDKLCSAAGAITDFEKLRQQQQSLKTPKDYRKHYMELAKGFSKVSGELKFISKKLPRGASDYLDFVFTVAEKSVVLANIANRHLETIEKESGAFASLSKNAHGRGSYFTSGKEVDSYGDVNKGLDAFFKKQKK